MLFLKILFPKFLLEIYLIWHFCKDGLIIYDPIYIYENMLPFNYVRIQLSFHVFICTTVDNNLGSDESHASHSTPKEIHWFLIHPDMMLKSYSGNSLCTDLPKWNHFSLLFICLQYLFRGNREKNVRCLLLKYKQVSDNFLLDAFAIIYWIMGLTISFRLSI